MSQAQPKRFLNDPALRSHHFKDKIEKLPVAGNMSDMWKGLTRGVACPDCGAPAGEQCRSQSQTHAGIALDGHHTGRYSAAKAKHGRKSS